MGCSNPKHFFAKRHGRFTIIPPGTILPGQTAPIDPRFAGIKGGWHEGELLALDCGRCKSCLFKLLMSRTGAMLSESQYAPQVAALTLTYGRDPGELTDTRADNAHKMLLPRHIREFRERLRRDSHYGKFRTVIAGEYGELRGRAHWHCIIFKDGDDGEFPEFDYGNKFAHFKHWPHGTSYADRDPGQKAFEYVCAYILKSMAGNKAGSSYMPGVQDVYISASKRPVMGYRHFINQARLAADFMIPPSFQYLPPGANRKYSYTMKDRSRDLYIDAYLDTLADIAPNDPSFGALRRPLMADPQGVAFGRPDDPWMTKAVLDGLRRREALLNPDDPAKLLRAEKAEHAEKIAEQAARAVRHEALERQRRDAAAVQRKLQANRELQVSFRDDPDDPFWDDWDAGAHARAVSKGEWWKI